MSKEVINNNSPGYGYNPPALDKFGRVIVSPVSLVATADRKPVSMGDRVRKYQRSPQFQHDLLKDAAYDADDHDPDVLADAHANPMSPHEDRYSDLLKRVSERKSKEAADKKAKEIEAEKAAKEAFRQRLRELQEEGSIPLRANPPDAAERAPNAGEA